jgi:hypothetical protein
MPLGRSSALTDFEKLFTEGNLQGKSYALVGIHKLNLARLKELARPFQDSNERVNTMDGCLILRKPLATILKLIESGQYR